MSHTPGPWEIDQIRPMRIVAKKAREDGATLVAYIGLYCEQDNARLIAAAPSLLNALKQAIAQIEDDYEATPLDGRSALINKLNAIVAKAEGR